MTESNEIALIQSAIGMRDELERRSVEIDKQGYLPQDLARRLSALGFYRLIVPESLGGLGVSPETFCKICEHLGSANGSAAWCVFIGTTSQYLFGALPSDQLEKMLEDPDVITSGVFADSGTALRETRAGVDGYRINGHWRWGSGCRNAAWISGGIHEIDEEGQRLEKSAPLTRVFFRPDEIDIRDNWQVSGLRGSGSNDFVADDVWVPVERMAGDIEDTEYATLPIYRFPKFALLGIPIGAICLGMARASIEEVIRVSKEKTPQGSRRSLAMRTSLHAEVAEADTSLRAAKAVFYEDIKEGWDRAQTISGSLEDRRRMRSSTVLAVNTSIEVISQMYRLVGGTSIFETSCLQQHFRDVHVASQHMMVGQPIMELAGRVLLGLDDTAIGL